MSADLQKLAAAKLWIVSAPPEGASRVDAPRGLPYLAHALYALVPVPTTRVRRMTCDASWRVYVNPDWLAAAEVPEIGRELAHVTWHLLGDHAGRARSLGVDHSTRRAWLFAADISVADTAGPDLRPYHLADPEEAGYERGLAAEQYFAVEQLLSATDDSRWEDSATSAGDDDPSPGDGDGCGSGADGLGRAWDLPAAAEAGAVDAFDARAIREYVAIEYRDHCAERGELPLGAERWINGILTPCVPWEQVLRSSVRRALGWATGRGEPSYARPSRRTATTPGIVLPGQVRAVPAVAIVLDTSGSVDDELLSRALGEVGGILSSSPSADTPVAVYSVDSEAAVSTRVRAVSDIRLVGGGGTDMRVGVAAALAARPRPDIVVVITDGHTPWPALAPMSTAVVAALLRRRIDPPAPPTPDWVLRVECTLDE